MTIMKRLLAALALAALAIAGPATAGEKPLIIQGAKIKQLPAATSLQLQAPTTANATVNLPHGTAPSSPTDGDCWTTTSGLFCRINGSTVGPYSTGGGGGAGDVTYLGRTAVTAATNVDIALPTGYDSFEIEFYLKAGTDSVGMNAQFTSDNFSTVLSGATDYHYNQHRSSAASAAVASSNGTTSFQLMPGANQGNDTNEYTNGRLHVLHAKESAPTALIGFYNYVTPAAAHGMVTFQGSYKPTTVINGIRITFTSGTATGFYRVWGRAAP